MIGSFPTHFSLVLIALLQGACLPGVEHQCLRASDCAPRDFCRAGECVPAVGITTPTPHEAVRSSGTTIFDFDADPEVIADQDSDPVEELDCSGGQLPTSQNLALNELLVHVPPGPEGDANGDGLRHAHDDEFIELVNRGAAPLIMTGVGITNDASLRFTFPPLCLLPLEAAVVFGGIEAGAPLAAEEGVHPFIADRRFAYANDGGRVRILDANAGILIQVDYGRSPPQSLVLEPEIFGEIYVPHKTLAPEALFSPGRCADGRPLSTRCVEEQPFDEGADVGPEPEQERDGH